MVRADGVRDAGAKPPLQGCEPAERFMQGAKDDREKWHGEGDVAAQRLPQFSQPVEDDQLAHVM